MQKQRECANQVKKDIATSREQEPAVYATIKSYMFEYSKSHDACVIVMQYNVQQKGKSPEVQVLALNAVTMQPMAGHKDVYLIPASDAKQIEDAADSLFEKYSH
jgi:hypothetical protein